MVLVGMIHGSQGFPIPPMGKPFKRRQGISGYPLSISGVYPIDDEEISTPPPSNSHHQDYYIFSLVGDPNRNLHLPQASWEGGQPNLYTTSSPCLLGSHMLPIPPFKGTKNNIKQPLVGRFETPQGLSESTPSVNPRTGGHQGKPGSLGQCSQNLKEDFS